MRAVGWGYYYTMRAVGMGIARGKTYTHTAYEHVDIDLALLF